MRKSNTGTATVVPVLDKGNHNNKKNLCDFIKQEEIAQQMLKEAQDFYNSFLKSKTITVADILKYPNVPLLYPILHLYYTKDKVVDNLSVRNVRVIPCRNDEDEVLITVSYSIDFGEESYGSINSAFGNILSDYENYRYENSNSWYKKYFVNSDKDYCDKIYKDWQDLERKLSSDIDGHDYKIGKITIGELKRLGVIPAKPENDTVLSTDGSWSYNDTFFTPFTYHRHGERYAKIGYRERYIENLNEVKNSEDIQKAIEDGSTRPEYIFYEKVNALPVYDLYRKVDIVKSAVDKFVNEYNSKVKECFNTLVTNIKKTNEPSIKRFYNSNIILEKSGRPRELLSNKIASTKINKSTGTYIVECEHLEDVRAKWSWPSNGPRIVTRYYQTFYFDIATNDLIDYKFTSSSQEVQYNYDY